MKTKKFDVKNTTIFYAILCCLIFSPLLNAQVTIGADKAPVEGAILQLKMDDNISENSKKGLILPRVNLQDKNNLFPMFEADGNDYKLGGIVYSKTDEDLKHIGLAIYNTNFCLNQTGHSNGPYIWNGNQWQSLISQDPIYPVKSFTDSRDGEVYTYRKFGDAGIWMLENLRIKRLPGSTNNIPIFDNTSNQTPFMAYPAPNEHQVETWKNSKYYDENPKLGVLYNWFAATNTTSSTAIGNVEQMQEFPLGGTIGQNEVENMGPLSDPSNPSVKFVQGICPDGWHLPSDREWNALEKHIYQNADQYSMYTPEQANQWNTAYPWDDKWEYGMTLNSFEWRGVPNDGTSGHGYAMMAPCGYYGATRGKSNSYWQGGFYALLAGMIRGTDAQYFYGMGASFWTSSSAIDPASGTDYNAWYRQIYNDQRGVRVLRYHNSRTFLQSVRCKKNNNEM